MALNSRLLPFLLFSLALLAVSSSSVQAVSLSVNGNQVVYSDKFALVNASITVNNQSNGFYSFPYTGTDAYGNLNYSWLIVFPNVIAANNFRYTCATWSSYQPLNVIGTGLFSIQESPLTSIVFGQGDLILADGKENLTDNITTWSDNTTGLNYYQLCSYRTVNTTIGPGLNLSRDPTVSYFSAPTWNLGAFNQTYANGSQNVYTYYYPGNQSFAPNGTYFSQPILMNGTTLYQTSSSNVTAINWTWFEAGGFYSQGNDSPLLDMHFENDTKDDSMYNDSGYAVNGPLSYNQACQVGGCFTFDGANNYMTGDSNGGLSNITGNITVSAWIKPVNVTKQQSILSRASGSNGIQYELDFSTAADIQFEANTGKAVGTLVAINKWQQVVGEYNGTGLLVFINGTLVGYTSYAGPLTYYGDKLGIGGRSDGGFLFNGSIDEVHVWNRSLSATEVSQLYGYESQGKFIHNFTNVTMALRAKSYSFNNSGLVGWWDLGDSSDNETVANKTLDLSGNGNNGALYNGTTLNSNGVIGKSLSFNALGQKVVISGANNVISGMNSWTIAEWVNPVGTGSYYPQFYNGNGLVGIAIHGTGMRIQGGNGTSFFDFTDLGGVDLRNKWSYTVVTYNGSAFVRYVNGVAKSTSNWALGLGDTAAYNIKFGTFWNNDFNGSIDDVKIWNRTLSAAEISALYNSGNPTGAGGQESNWTSWTTPEMTGGSNTSITGVGGNICQYRATFTSTSTNYSAFLQNVSLTYLHPSPFYTTLLTPLNGSNTSGTPSLSGNVNFSYSPNSTSGSFGNATLYANWGGAWVANNSNATSLVNGTVNNITVNGIPQGNWVWNVLACDANNCSFAPQNYSFTFTPQTPYWFNPSVNSSQANASIQFSVYTNDSWPALANWTFASNETGSFINQSLNSYGGLNASRLNATIVTPATLGGYVCGYWYFNDTGGSSNTTPNTCVTLTDSVPPTLSAITFNTSIAGAVEGVTVTAYDNVNLAALIFSLDNGTGTLSNVTTVLVSGNSATNTFVFVLPSSLSSTIRFGVWVNDTAGNLVFSGLITTYTVTPPISTSASVPNPYFWPAIVVFLLGLSLACFGWLTQHRALIFLAGLTWVVLGVMILSGQAIPNQLSSFKNYTYASNTSIQNVSTTVVFAPLNNGNDFYSLGIIGLTGFGVLVSGLYLCCMVLINLLKEVEAGKRGVEPETE